MSPINVEKSPQRTSPRKLQTLSPNNPTSSDCSSLEGSPGTSLTIELPDFMPLVKSCLQEGDSNGQVIKMVSFKDRCMYMLAIPWQKIRKSMVKYTVNTSSTFYM